MDPSAGADGAGGVFAGLVSDAVAKVEGGKAAGGGNVAASAVPGGPLAAGAGEAGSSDADKVVAGAAAALLALIGAGGEEADAPPQPTTPSGVEAPGLSVAVTAIGKTDKTDKTDKAGKPGTPDGENKLPPQASSVAKALAEAKTGEGGEPEDAAPDEEGDAAAVALDLLGALLAMAPDDVEAPAIGPSENDGAPVPTTPTEADADASSGPAADTASDLAAASAAGGEPEAATSTAPSVSQAGTPPLPAASQTVQTAVVVPVPAPVAAVQLAAVSPTEAADAPTAVQGVQTQKSYGPKSAGTFTPPGQVRIDLTTGEGETKGPALIPVQAAAVTTSPVISAAVAAAQAPTETPQPAPAGPVAPPTDEGVTGTPAPMTTPSAPVATAPVPAAPTVPTAPAVAIDASAVTQANTVEGDATAATATASADEASTPPPAATPDAAVDVDGQLSTSQAADEGLTPSDDATADAVKVETAKAETAKAEAVRQAAAEQPAPTEEPIAVLTKAAREALPEDLAPSVEGEAKPKAEAETVPADSADEEGASEAPRPASVAKLELPSQAVKPNGGVGQTAQTFVEHLKSEAAKSGVEAVTVDATASGTVTGRTQAGFAAELAGTGTGGQSTGGQGVPPQSVGIEIARRFGAGETSFRIRLTPEDLGQIDVQLDFSENGEARAHIQVERREAYELLQRDHKVIEKTLREAGFETKENSVSLSMRQDGGSGQGDRPTAQQQMADQQGQNGQGRHRHPLEVLQSGEGDAPRPIADLYRPRSDALVDVRV